MKAIKSALLGVALLRRPAACRRRTSSSSRCCPIGSGPYAAGGSGYYGGAIDYWTLDQHDAAASTA